MTDFSNPSNMAARDKLLEEYKREYDGAVRRLFLSSCHTTEQGVKKINECQIPSTIEILMEMRSSGTLSNVISSVVKDLIDQIDSSIQAHVAQKSVIEKPTNNPHKSLPDVAGQAVTGRLKPNLLIKNPLASARKLILVLLHSGGNKTKAKAPVVPQPV